MVLYILIVLAFETRKDTNAIYEYPDTLQYDVTMYFQTVLYLSPYWISIVSKGCVIKKRIDSESTRRHKLLAPGGTNDRHVLATARRASRRQWGGGGRGGGVAGGGSLDGVKQPSSGSSGRMSLPNERRGTNCWVSFFAGSFFVDCWRTLRRFSFIFPLEFVNLRIG